MKQRMKIAIHLVALLACTSALGSSNPIEGGSTEMVATNWNVAVPWLMVGSNSSSNMLFVSNGGQVNNQIGIIGNNASSMQNMAVVSGSNAVWNSALEVSVGNLGSDNTLGVFSGGQVNTENAYIGKASTNNFAAISGTGSELSATTLHIGHTGADNAMEILDGGTVSSEEASLGHWIGSDDNSALVMGTNSMWNNTGILNVGEHGSDNSLIIMDDGTVQSPIVNLGVYSYSSNNTVAVFGENARLDAPELNIGGTATTVGGTGNRVEVQNGGTVATTDLTIHVGNDFDLNDGGTLAVDNDFDASLAGFNFNSGGTLEVGGTLEYQTSATYWLVNLEDQRSIVLNGSNAYWQVPGLHSTLNIGNNTSGNSLVLTNGGSGYVSHAFIGESQNSHSNEVKVVDGGVWRNQTLMVGAGGDENQMLIAENGRVENRSTGIGYEPGSDSNTLIVTGENAVLHSREAIHLGGYKHGTEWDDGGSGNLLIISDGGLVLVGDVNTNNLPNIGTAGGIAVGDASGAAELVAANASRIETGNAYVGLGAAESGSIQLTGGSQMNLTKNLYVGYEGSDNNLTVDDGGTVSVKDWLLIGYEGSSNSLLISNGGRVDASYLDIGNDDQSANNTVVVSGSNSVLNGGSRIRIGYDGAGNTLDVRDGALVESRTGIIGGRSSNNVVSVSGPGSIWRNSEGLRIGDYGGALWYPWGNGNILSISDGGVVYSGSMDVVNSGGSSNNLVSVTGSGSMLVCSNYLAIGSGNDEGENRLLVSDGGRVVGDGYIGRASSSNRVVISGSGSVWSNSGSLVVGQYGSGNLMTVEDGGAVQSGWSSIGETKNANGNRVVVTDAGSRWDTERLDVGSSGFGNSLIITNGGKVASADARVGETGNGNTVIVTGADSVWTNSVHLIVGTQGSDNALHILDGARVQSAFVGVTSPGLNQNLAGGSNNVVRVSGAGSTLDVSGETAYVGLDGMLEVGNGSLLIEDGGAVFADRTRVGGNVIVDGSGSVWSNRSFITVGSPAGVTVSDGGTVFAESAETGGEITIEGAGSEWVVTDSFLSVSSTTVRDGGQINAGTATIDRAGITTVSGVGSALNVESALTIGDYYGGNTLLIEIGGLVESGSGIIGGQYLSTGNSVSVSGAGSYWGNSTGLQVGGNGSGNLMTVEDGGRVHAGWNGSIGYADGANGNRVVVRGEDSTLSTGWGVSVLRPEIIAPPVSIWPYPTNQPPVTVLPPIDFPPYLTNGPIPYVVYTVPTNQVPVNSGSEAVWTGGDLVVGSVSNNTLVLTEGATVSGGEGLRYNFGTIENDYFGGNFVGGTAGTTNNVLDVADGGLVVVATNELISITNYPPPVFAMRMDLSQGELSVGRGGSGNTLDILDGALVSGYNGIIGETSNAWNNAVSVVGTNSQWRNSGSLYIGGRMSPYYYMTTAGWENEWVDGGQGNSLYVGDGGLVSVGRDLHNRNHSLVSIDPGGHITVSSNYYQDATSVLRFGVETNAAGAPLNAFVSVGGTAEFETGATLEYQSNVGVLEFDTFYTNLIVEANQLIVAGVTNANAVDLEAINLDGSLVDVMLWEDDQDIYGLVGRRHLEDSAGFAPGSEMANISKEIDDQSLLGEPRAERQINVLNSMSSEQQNKELTQRYDQGAPTHMHAQAMLNGRKQILTQSRSFQAANRSGGASPEGPSGPHMADQGLRGWTRAYGGWVNRDGGRSYSGFDQNIYGTVVGIDQSFGNILVGAAGGYSYSDIDVDNDDSTDAKTGYGILYVSVGTTAWFGDLNVAYGRSRISTDSGSAFSANADFDANTYAAYIGGGREFKFLDGNLLFTPEVAMQIGYFDQESYTEDSSYVSRDIDSYDRWSYQSRLGASLAVVQQVGSVVLQPELRAYWLHEFENNDDHLDYSLTGASDRYTFGMQAPDEDILEAGAGVTARFNEQLELVLDIDGQYCDRYNALILGARVNYEF